MARTESKTKTFRHSYGRDFHAQWRGWGGTGPYVQEPHPRTLRVTDSVTYGANLPNWRELLQSGNSATTTLVGVRYSSKASELRQDVVGKGPAKGFGRIATGFSPQHYFPAPPLATVDSVAEQKAASSFLADYLKATQSWKGGATIAEFSETINMLANPIDSLYKRTITFVGSVGRLKRVYKRDPIRYGKLLGQLWLAYAFGIAPLVGDVNDAYAAVKSLSEDLGAVDTKRIIGSGYNKVILNSTLGETVSYADYCFADRTLFVENGVRYLGAVRCTPPGPAAIAEDFGVGFADILPSVWEGIPWSWLVDYFVNVNEMLESIRLAFADFAWLNRTVRNRAVQYWTAVRPADSNSYYDVTASGGQGYYQSKVVVRVATTVPYPSWRFRIPGLPRQFANVSALVLAIKGSKPKSHRPL